MYIYIYIYYTHINTYIYIHTRRYAATIPLLMIDILHSFRYHAQTPKYHGTMHEARQGLCHQLFEPQSREYFLA